MTIAVQSRPHTMHAAIRGMGGTVLAKGPLTLVIDEVGLFINHRTQEPTGVDAWVRLFVNGSELPVDPHRIFINPPLIHDRIFDPRAAFEVILWQSVLNVPNPKGWRTRGTVTTVYAGTADDAIISITESGNYSAARAGTADVFTLHSDAVDGNGETLTLFSGDINFDGSTIIVGLSYIAFDTSSLPDTDSVSAAALSLFEANGTGVYDTVNDGSTTYRAYTYNWGASVTTGDWRTAAQENALTILATLASGSISTNAYNAFTESGTNFQSAIAKTGTTYLLIGTNRTAAGTAPGSGTQQTLEYYAADNTGTTNDPKLVITHAAAGVSVTPGNLATTTSRFAPTVSVSNNKSVSPAQLAATTSRLTPTITVSDNKSASPGSLSNSLTGYAPTVSISDNKSVSPSILALLTSLLTPSVALGQNVSPDSLSTQLTQQTPTILNPKTAEPGSLSVSLTQQTPSVVSGFRSSPDTLPVALLQQTPSVETPVSVFPSTKSVTANTQDPTISVGVNVSPDAKSVILTGYTPIIALALSPGSLSVALAQQTPSVTVGIVTSPAALALSTSTFAPAITNPQTLTPNIVSVVIALKSPNVNVYDSRVRFYPTVKTLNTKPPVVGRARLSRRSNLD